MTTPARLVRYEESDCPRCRIPVPLDECKTGVFVKAADVEALLNDMRRLLEHVPGHTDCADCRAEAKALLAALATHKAGGR